MKLRFSLRWLFAGITAFPILLYLFFIRPGQLANEFVRQIARQDYSQLKCLSMDGVTVLDTLRSLPSYSDETLDVGASVQPSEYAGVFGTRRLVVVTVQAPNKNRESVRQFTYLIQSGPTGLKLVQGIPFEYLKMQRQ